MNAGDVMTTEVISVGPETTIAQAAGLMIERHVSGFPVVEADGSVVGVVSEGDLLRRLETGTERRRSWWLELFASNEKLAREYTKSHGRKVKDVMTRTLVSVEESTPLHEVADLLESRRIKRVPVLRNRRIVGIVSRANIVQALASAKVASRPATRSDINDQTIRERLLAELKPRKWAAAPGNIVVSDGIVHLWGEVNSEEEREALRVAAENIPGVIAVKDHTILPPVFPPI